MILANIFLVGDLMIFLRRYPSKADAEHTLPSRYVTTLISLLLATRAVQYLGMNPTDIADELRVDDEDPGTTRMEWCMKKAVRIYRTKNRPVPSPQHDDSARQNFFESIVTWCLGSDRRMSGSDVRVLFTEVWAQSLLSPRAFLRVLTQVLEQAHIKEIQVTLSEELTPAKIPELAGAVIEQGVYIQLVALRALRSCDAAFRGAGLEPPWPLPSEDIAMSPNSLAETLLAAVKYCMATGTLSPGTSLTEMWVT
jgi:hypothetical protein